MSGCSADTTEPYALRVTGDSMEPEFSDGHIIIVDPGLSVFEDAYIIVDYGGEVMLGQYTQSQELPVIRYLNPDYQAVTLTPPYEIKGVVTQRVGKRRKDRKYYEHPDITGHW